MDSDEESCTMLDLLAYNCIELKDSLETAGGPGDEEKIIFEYLKKSNDLHKPISDFKEDSDWFNVTEPLSSECLKGKIIVLDFFTYCCINCMHILPGLKAIEQLISVEDGLLIIGVHSAKFENEKDSSNLLSAIQRYDITHPVINDVNSSMWNELNIKCWPTLLILGPSLNPIFVLMGEESYETLKKFVSTSLKYYRGLGEIREHSLPLNPATELIVSHSLKFPGKIVCLKKNPMENCAELYAVSDSGNNRVLILNAAGEVLQKIGGKLSGMVDGDFKSARFNNPQGIDFLNNDILFVADTDNHAIRRINLRKKMVETIVGTGKQGFDMKGGGFGIEQEISSPWDLCVIRAKDQDMSFHMEESEMAKKVMLVIAMAGTHQVWAYFLDDIIWWKSLKYVAENCCAIAGNGLEANQNNSYPQNASFAQPSGITFASTSNQLFIADSESSSIRSLALDCGKVAAVAGAERNPSNLFAYGDTDGVGYTAKFQHPLAVAYNESDEHIYVADTYNHKIKKIDIKTATVSTCSFSLKGQFNEPGGLCLNPNGDVLYVADTNNHSIEVIQLETGKQKTLNIQFDLQTNRRQELGTVIWYPQLLRMNKLGGKIKLSVSIQLVDVHLTEGAPQKWNVYLPNQSWYIGQPNGVYTPNESIELDITSPRQQISSTGPGELVSETRGEIVLTVKLSLCRNNLCFPKMFSLKFETVYDESGLDFIIEEVVCIVDENGVKL